MKNIVLFFFIFCVTSCNQNHKNSNASFSSYQEIINWIKNPTDDHVMVVAHRGDWRNAPENSIKAIENAIEMGVEIIEIDLRKTKDNHIMIIHDKTLDRTTTGKGKVSKWTLDSLKTLYLKNGIGAKTNHKIPTLKEMMLTIKDKPILVNLDKAWGYLPETFKILEETGTIKQCIFKGNEPYEVMRTKHKDLLDKIIYMPMVWPPDYNIYKNEKDRVKDPIKYTKDYIKGLNPLAFEVIYSKEKSIVFDAIKILKKQKIAVWVNTLWGKLCAYHHDDVAINNPEVHYGWIIKNGANIIQTDRPKFLIEYLKYKDLRK